MSSDWAHKLYYEDIPYDLSISYRTDAEGHQGTLHIHDVYELLLVLTDGVTVKIEKHEYAVPKNALLLFTPMDLHCVASQAGQSYNRFLLYLCPEQIDTLSTEQFHLLECFYRRPFAMPQILPLTSEQTNILLPLYQQLNDVAADTRELLGNDLLKHFLVGQILIHVNRFYLTHHDIPAVQAGSDFHHIHTVLDYIAAHYMEKITLADLAQTVFLSTHYLCRLFKQIIGSSPMEYLSSLRMVKAKELLLRGCSVDDTCARVGYGNLSHFSRQFKQKVGISPRQYMMLNRRKA